MQSFTIRIEDRALLDIQQGFDYYENLQAGFGVRFNQSIFHSFETLQLNPFYQVRYDEIRCLPVKKFPYMVHYKVNEAEGIVYVLAVINTYRDPDKTWPRNL
jgi:toxin ParE1/3/4